MTDAVKYRYDRVLIETLRVLEPTLPSVVVSLSGGQVEILRNIMDYANRQDSFVSEYRDDDYIPPNDEDFSGILVVVADIERQLMGMENTIFGYNNTLHTSVVNTYAAEGTNDVDTSAVPAGEVWVITSICAWNATSGLTASQLAKLVTTAMFYVSQLVAPVVGQFIEYQGWLVLKAGEQLRYRAKGATLGDDLYLMVTGFRMKVAE